MFLLSYPCNSVTLTIHCRFVALRNSFLGNLGKVCLQDFICSLSFLVLLSSIMDFCFQFINWREESFKSFGAPKHTLSLQQSGKKQKIIHLYHKLKLIVTFTLREQQNMCTLALVGWKKLKASVKHF